VDDVEVDDGDEEEGEEEEGEEEEGEEEEGEDALTPVTRGGEVDDADITRMTVSPEALAVCVTLGQLSQTIVTCFEAVLDALGKKKSIRVDFGQVPSVSQRVTQEGGKKGGVGKSPVTSAPFVRKDGAYTSDEINKLVKKKSGALNSAEARRAFLVTCGVPHDEVDEMSDRSLSLKVRAFLTRPIPRERPSATSPGKRRKAGKSRR